MRQERWKIEFIVSVNPAVRIARSLVSPAAPVGNQKQRNHDNARRYKRGL